MAPAMLFVTIEMVPALSTMYATVLLVTQEINVKYQFALENSLQQHMYALEMVPV
jgi:hypothetical protein